MSARTALLNLARRAGAAPTRVARRNMSGGGTVEEEIAEMKKWKGVSFIAMPACVCLGAWSFMNQEHHHPAERPAYSYLNIRNKIMPWGGKCGLFEYGKCQEPDDE